MAPEAEERGFGRLTRDSLLFSLGAVAGKAVGAALLPFLTRTLTPAALGRFDVLSTMVSALGSVLVLGLDVAVTRYWYDRDRESRPRLFVTAMVVGVGVSAAVALLLALFAAPLSEAFFDTDRWSSGFILVGIATIGTVASLLVLTFPRVQHRPLVYAALAAGGFLVNGIAAVVLVLNWQRDLIALLLAMVIGQAVLVLAGLVVARHFLRARPSRPDARVLLALGVPLVPAAAAPAIADLVNRTVVIITAGASQAGYLSVALRIASVVVLVVAGFQLAWQPVAFRRGTSPAARDRTGREAELIVACVAGAVILIAAIAPEAVSILGTKAFEPALPALGWLLIWALALGLFLVASMASTLALTTREIGVASGIGILMTIVLTFALAPSGGASGAAAAMAGGQLIAAGLAALYAKRRPSLGIHRAAVVPPVVVAITLSLVATLPEGGAPVWVRLVGALLGAATLAWTVREVRAQRAARSRSPLA